MQHCRRPNLEKVVRCCEAPNFSGTLTDEKAAFLYNILKMRRDIIVDTKEFIFLLQVNYFFSPLLMMKNSFKGLWTKNTPLSKKNKTNNNKTIIRERKNRGNCLQDEGSSQNLNEELLIE